MLLWFKKHIRLKTRSSSCISSETDVRFFSKNELILLFFVQFELKPSGGSYAENLDNLIIALKYYLHMSGLARIYLG